MLKSFRMWRNGKKMWRKKNNHGLQSIFGKFSLGRRQIEVLRQAKLGFAMTSVLGLAFFLLYSKLLDGSRS